jgi:hypothetical protein
VSTGELPRRRNVDTTIAGLSENLMVLDRLLLNSYHPNKLLSLVWSHDADSIKTSSFQGSEASSCCLDEQWVITMNNSG